jgi:hypothetical protein
MSFPKRLHGADLAAKPGEQLFGDGDWFRNAWFLQPNYEREFRPLGWSRSAVANGVRALQRLFPPEVCRENDRPWFGGLYLPLFDLMRYPHSVVPLLAVGRDLDAANAWHDDELVKRLQNRTHFSGAEFELRTWANLARRGYQHERLFSTPDNPAPDFRVRIGGAWFSLECKAQGPSDADEVHEEWSFAAFIVGEQNFFVPGFHCHIEASPEYGRLIETQTGRDRLRREKKQIEQAFRAASLKLKVVPGARNEVDVHPYGSLRYEESAEVKQGGMNAAFLGELTAEQEAEKVRQVVHKALRQLNAVEIPGFVMVQVAPETSFDLVVEEVTRDRKANPVDFRRCAGVILVAFSTTKRGDHEAVARVFHMSDTPDRESLLRFAREVSSSVWRTPWPLGAD